MILKKQDFFSALDISRPPIIVAPYWISTIWRGREVSRPYHTKSFLRNLMLFFRFLFLIPFTIRQQCTIYLPVIFHRTVATGRWNRKEGVNFLGKYCGGMLAYLEYFNEFWKNIISVCDLMVFWGMLSPKIGFLYIWYNQLYRWYNQLYRAYLLF